MSSLPITPSPFENEIDFSAVVGFFFFDRIIGYFLNLKCQTKTLYVKCALLVIVLSKQIGTHEFYSVTSV